MSTDVKRGRVKCIFIMIEEVSEVAGGEAEEQRQRTCLKTRVEQDVCQANFT